MITSEMDAILRVCALVPTYSDDPFETVASIRAQVNSSADVFVVVGSKLLFDLVQTRLDAHYEFVEPDTDLPTGVRIARSLNCVLETIDLLRYDFVLRVDADVELPPTFTNSNAKTDADMIGESVATLIKPQVLKRFFGGRFPEVNREDTYLSLKLQSAGCRVSKWSTPPVMKRRPGVNKPLRYFIDGGVEMWKWGYEPVHVVGDAILNVLLGYDIRSVFECVGYFRSMLTRKEKYDFAPYVMRNQLVHLFRSIRSAVISRSLFS